MTEPTPHPATYSDGLLPWIARYLDGAEEVLDVFGGVGKLGRVKHFGYAGRVVINELEAEWAEQAHAHGVDEVRVGDACALPASWSGRFPMVATSSTYGNRMADTYKGDKKGSKRITYTIYLGRDLTPGNAGAMQWGPKYRDLHVRAWQEVWRVLREGGLFVLNVSDHYRGKKLRQVTRWHLLTLQAMGFVLVDWRRVKTPRMGFGANGQNRAPYESLLVFVKGHEHARKIIDERGAAWDAPLEAPPPSGEEGP